MSAQGTHLVYKTIEDVARIKNDLAEIHNLIDQISERFGALGVAALAGFEWPSDGQEPPTFYYTQDDFTSLVTVLSALPDSVVTTSSRNAIFKLIASFQ